MSSSTPSRLPLYLAHCSDATSRDSIRTLVAKLHPEENRFCTYKQEFRALRLVRERLLDCIDHVEGVSNVGHERIVKGLGAAVARWEAASNSDQCAAVHLDGESPCCLFRCVVYQHAGMTSPLKQFLSNEAIFSKVPAAAAYALILLRFVLQHRALLYQIYWGQPLGLSKLRNNIAYALQNAQALRIPADSLLHANLTAVAGHMDGTAFRVYRNQVRAVEKPPPMPTHLDYSGSAEAPTPRRSRKRRARRGSHAGSTAAMDAAAGPSGFSDTGAYGSEPPSSVLVAPQAVEPSGVDWRSELGREDAAWEQRRALARVPAAAAAASSMPAHQSEPSASTNHAAVGGAPPAEVAPGPGAPLLAAGLYPALSAANPMHEEPLVGGSGVLDGRAGGSDEGLLRTEADLARSPREGSEGNGTAAPNSPAADPGSVTAEVGGWGTAGPAEARPSPSPSPSPRPSTPGTSPPVVSPGRTMGGNAVATPSSGISDLTVHSDGASDGGKGDRGGPAHAGAEADHRNAAHALDWPGTCSGLTREPLAASPSCVAPAVDAGAAAMDAVVGDAAGGSHTSDESAAVSAGGDSSAAARADAQGRAAEMSGAGSQDAHKLASAYAEVHSGDDATTLLLPEESRGLRQASGRLSASRGRSVAGAAAPGTASPVAATAGNGGGSEAANDVGALNRRSRRSRSRRRSDWDAGSSLSSPDRSPIGRSASAVRDQWQARVDRAAAEGASSVVDSDKAAELVSAALPDGDTMYAAYYRDSAAAAMAAARAHWFADMADKPAELRPHFESVATPEEHQAKIAEAAQELQALELRATQNAAAAAAAAAARPPRGRAHAGRGLLPRGLAAAATPAFEGGRVPASIMDSIHGDSMFATRDSFDFELPGLPEWAQAAMHAQLGTTEDIAAEMEGACAAEPRDSARHIGHSTHWVRKV